MAEHVLTVARTAAFGNRLLVFLGLVWCAMQTVECLVLHIPFLNSFFLKKGKKTSQFKLLKEALCSL